MVSLQQLNFLLQIVIFVLISVSMYSLKKNRDFSLHGRLMLGAVVLNFISFLFVMGPSIFGLRQFIIEKPTNILAISTIVHAGFGTIAEVFGISIVFPWLIKPLTKNCVKKKGIMRLTVIVWLIALFSGFLEYVILYIY